VDVIGVMASKKHWLVLLCLLASLTALLFYSDRSDKVDPSDQTSLHTHTRPSAPFIGESILKDYAKPGSDPKNDLTWMHRALGNFSLLVKGDNPLPLGSNEEIAAALRGRNRAQLRFLPDDHPAFNASGQIIDRWNTPLFFHATSRDRMDIRSAGPDREMWTADDLHRKHDGTTLSGAALPP
jgi:hypothetical protein